MPSIGIIALNNGQIVRVYKSAEEEALYAALGSIPNTQGKVSVDLENNPVFQELINVNELYRWRLNASVFTRDGATIPVHAATEAENTRVSLPDIVQRLKEYRQLDVLSGTATAAETRAMVIRTQEATDDVINLLQYIAKNHLKIVP